MQRGEWPSRQVEVVIVTLEAFVIVHNSLWSTKQNVKASNLKIGMQPIVLLGPRYP